MILQPSVDRQSVVIQIPADATFIRVARLATSGTATLAGFDVDTIDDLRIAVDEMAATLIELAEPDRSLTLTMQIEADVLRIIGEVETSADPTRADPTRADPTGLNPERHALGRMILDAITDHHELEVEGGVARFVIERLRLAAPDDVADDER